MTNKFISLSKKYLLIGIAIGLFISAIVLMGGTLSGEFESDEIDVDYEVMEAGSSVSVEGGIYQYDSLSETQQETIDKITVDGQESVNVNNYSYIPDENMHTVEKDGMMYVMRSTSSYNERSNIFFHLSLLMIMSSFLCVLIYEN